jgi:hypothetical protein
MTAHRFETVYRNGQRLTECSRCSIRIGWAGAKDDCVSRGHRISDEARVRHRTNEWARYIAKKKAAETLLRHQEEAALRARQRRAEAAE